MWEYRWGNPWHCLKRSERVSRYSCKAEMSGQADGRVDFSLIWPNVPTSYFPGIPGGRDMIWDAGPDTPFLNTWVRQTDRCRGGRWGLEQKHKFGLSEWNQGLLKMISKIIKTHFPHSILFHNQSLSHTVVQLKLNAFWNFQSAVFHPADSTEWTILRRGKKQTFFSARWRWVTDHGSQGAAESQLTLSWVTQARAWAGTSVEDRCSLEPLEACYIRVEWSCQKT